MRKVIALGAVAATTATAFVGVGAASATPVSSQRASATPTVTWGSCPEDYPAAIQCSTLTVPLDYARPGGKTLDIVISRAKATGTAAERQGVLLVNRGGPGGTGVAYAASVQNRLPDSLKKAYDVIGFDPRGVGLSHPIYCVDPDVFFKAPAPDPIPAGSAGLAVNTARALQYASGCIQRNGADIRFFNTPNTARDMDRIRAALGEEKINYLGYSYGTYLGAVYTSLFPQHARRVLLDSNIDPNGVWYEDNLSQNVAFDLSFREFLRWVASNDAAYHLGTSATEVRRAWYAMRAALVKTPAGGVVGPAELDNIAAGSMYHDTAWPDLAQAFSDYAHGDPAALIAQFGPTDLAGENGNAVYTTVECNDKVWPHNLATWFADASRQYRQYPFEVWANTWLNMPCAFWPFSATRATRIGGQGLPRILMVNSTGDPATPYDGALRMHRALAGSRFITVTGNGNHGQYLYEKNPCTDGYGSAYLLSGALPAKDASCVGNPHPTPAPATASAATGKASASRAAREAAERPGPVR